MGRIYEDATNTIIYLGPAVTESLESQCLRAVRQGRPPSDAQLLSILSKSWFTRVWVFQELVFASNSWIQCGKARARWATICRKMMSVSKDLLDEKQRERQRIVTQMNEAWDQQRPKKATKSDYQSKSFGKRSPFKNTVLELVKARRGLGVFDPRDMVFAHVGFAKDAEHGKLKIDYSKTIEEVYIDFALFIAQKEGWGTLLDNVGDPKIQSRFKNLPPWSPDWTVPFSTPLFPRQTAFGLNGLPRETGTFHILAFDTIKSVSLELQLGQFPPELYRDFGSRLLALDIELEEGYIHGSRKDLDQLIEQWTEACQTWRTFVGGEILHPQLSSLPLTYFPHPETTTGCTTHERCHILEVSIQMFLTLAFRTDLKFDILKGKALALTKCKLGWLWFQRPAKKGI